MCINPAVSVLKAKLKVVLIYFFKKERNLLSGLSVALNSGWICKLSLSLPLNVTKQCLISPSLPYIVVTENSMKQSAREKRNFASKPF